MGTKLRVAYSRNHLYAGHDLPVLDRRCKLEESSPFFDFDFDFDSLLTLAVLGTVFATAMLVLVPESEVRSQQELLRPLGDWVDIMYGWRREATLEPVLEGVCGWEGGV